MKTNGTFMKTLSLVLLVLFAVEANANCVADRNQLSVNNQVIISKFQKIAGAHNAIYGTNCKKISITLEDYCDGSNHYIGTSALVSVTMKSGTVYPTGTSDVLSARYTANVNNKNEGRVIAYPNRIELKYRPIENGPDYKEVNFIAILADTGALDFAQIVSKDEATEIVRAVTCQGL